TGTGNRQQSRKSEGAERSQRVSHHKYPPKRRSLEKQDGSRLDREPYRNLFLLPTLAMTHVVAMSASERGLSLAFENPGKMRKSPFGYSVPSFGLSKGGVSAFTRGSVSPSRRNFRTW